MIEYKHFDHFNPELKSYWTQLESTSINTCFQTFDWNFQWYINVGIKKNIKLSIVAVLNNSIPIIIFPFCITTKFKFSILQFLASDLGDYLNIIYSEDLHEEEIITIFKDAISRIGLIDLIYLDKIPLHHTTKLNKFLSTNLTQFRSNSFQTYLPSSTDELFNGIGKKVINDTKRQIKRISALGNISFNYTTNICLENKILLDEFISQKQNRLLEIGAKNIFSNKDIQTLYRTFSTQSTGFNVHFSWLTVNESVIATHWGLTYNDHFYFLIPTFNNIDWGIYSPGKIHLHYLLQWAVENKFKVFDFTIGAEEYKRIYCNKVTPLFQYIEYKSFRSNILTPYFVCLTNIYQSDKLRIRIKRFLNILNKSRNVFKRSD